MPLGHPLQSSFICITRSEGWFVLTCRLLCRGTSDSEACPACQDLQVKASQDLRYTMASLFALLSSLCSNYKSAWRQKSSNPFVKGRNLTRRSSASLRFPPLHSSAPSLVSYISHALRVTCPNVCMKSNVTMDSHLISDNDESRPTLKARA